MCRLLGYVTTRPTSVVDVLGPDDFETFTALTEVHSDGWGMAWHRAFGDSTESVSSACNASIDPQYKTLSEQPLGCCGLVHLRWATGGLPVSAENTHPFTDAGYAFAHNGHIAPIAHLEAQLDPASREKLIGDTDSERYFRLIMQCIDEAAGDEADGVTRALEILVREFPNSSLNALLLTPSNLFAIHINSRVDSPVEALREMFESVEAIPASHATEYYAMDYRITDDAVHVISSGVDAEGWTRVPEDAAVMIDLATREVTRLHPVPLA
ncbi:class II glutamine amidotransferase [Microbacterium sp.]|uniref:class II glutamine amidotransferase n=1 Tax=Microbacterium sp. TaxID=51671 RepID=UPI002608CFF9|nr:class II glutamine amidotransferase [Microbacterium sp.]